MRTELDARAELEALAHRYIDGLRRHDPAATAALHAPHGIVESPMFATVHGRAAIEDSYRQLYTIFPDMEFVLQALLVDPPRYAVITANAATQEGEFYGLPPTHKRIEFTLVRVGTIENGLIEHERRIYDFTGLLVQVGVLRAKPAKP